MKKYQYHCPVEGCSATATSGAGMSAHLRGAHPASWAGNVRKTLEALGKETMTVDITEDGRTETTEQKPRSSQDRPDRPKPKPKKRRVHRRKPPLQHAANSKPNSEPKIGSINHCPICGNKIRHFLLAAGFNQIEQEGEGA